MAMRGHMPNQPVTLHVLLDGEQIGDPIPAVMRMGQTAPLEHVVVTFPRAGQVEVQSRAEDGTVLETMSGAVDEGQSLAFDPAPPPPQPVAADVLATDAQYRLYRESLDYLTATGQLDPKDDEAVERLRMRIARDIVEGADAARIVLERQVRGRIRERYRKLELPWKEGLCNLWTDTPHVLCGLTPGHLGGHHA